MSSRPPAASNTTPHRCCAPRDDGGRFEGDSLDAVLSWKGGDDFAPVRDRAPRLHFWLNRARLYTFWFE